ncbi:hypothetical protein AA0113_g3085 [Alternaria arborescens]|uniref:Uncharacterized protein n=2 Tax=Alternaria sect. Alternaria TaxID=2499237 RepID=A0A4V1X7L6_9PLEO|nr:hypothetical protein AA0111_g2310 [Alternaria arborescens]KAB2104548.1 hypothetical protein AG0111_0g7635 [Alternaria gaisen]RYN27992.1 hypothetical protein AA0112_g7631 [Alternaria arborescens]RYO37739.1 hypothetical protein AA0111_g2310 [Alternaria arborescens]RYO70418.1 hypothetical protein AA0113_g3085 [Alternaria arborescens]
MSLSTVGFWALEYDKRWICKMIIQPTGIHKAERAKFGVQS